MCDRLPLDDSRRTAHQASMPLHMIKLCVGVSDVAWLEKRARTGRPLVITTRMTPKRAVEVEDGGSLYWVVKGSVQCRQPILDLTTHGEGRTSHCDITLAPEVIRTAPLPRQPFQGWRYLEPKEAPPDLSSAGDTDLPDELVKQLRELGAW